MAIDIDLQVETDKKNLPAKAQFKSWVKAAFQDQIKRGVICIRIVTATEIAQINAQFRHKPKPTNIISFSYLNDSHEHEAKPLLGDLAICAAVIEVEAKEQKIALMAHWAHIVVHGCLHILGYDHKTDHEAEIMEQKEAEILAQLGYAVFIAK